MVLHSQTDMSPLINSHFSGRKHSIKQQAVLFLCCSLCMSLWRWLLLMFSFYSVWHIMDVLGIKIMSCLMVVRTITVIILSNVFLRT